MWLIDTATFKLKQFPSSESVEYAVLSHTWEGDNDEVTFQELADGRRPSNKPGWKKIEKTCELAREIHLKYAWVDTCCIDKTSSAELSEAINSMFSWYRHSKRCFVYLSTYTDEALSQDQQSRIPVADDLAKYKWFERGWTLQELIAPPMITFVDRNWGFRGTKETLCDALANITGIDTAVLKSVDALPTITVGKRFSWAANRKTKRVEDLAYCLLGIFGVNMPLLYGEGPKAFLRLQEEIARSTNDLTLFAWQQDRPTSQLNARVRGMFANSPSEFRHCDKILVLHEKLELETEFTLTNRGLRFDRNFAVAGIEPGAPMGSQPDHDLVMGLDCLERSERTEHEPRWIGLCLRRVGATYVRVFPNDFHYSPSRISSLNSAGKRVAYTATSLSDLDTQVIHTNVTVGIFYHRSLRTIVPDDNRGSSRLPIPYGSMHYADSFGSRGLRSCMHLHLFTVKLGTPPEDFRVALVCGLRVGTKLDHLDQNPWVLLCSEKQFSHSLDHPICKLDAFGSTEKAGGLSFAEKRKSFAITFSRDTWVNQGF